MSQLTWQAVVLYCVAIVVLGTITAIGFFMETDGIDKVAFGAILVLLGFGGGRIQGVFDGKGNGRRSGE